MLCGPKLEKNLNFSPTIPSIHLATWPKRPIQASRARCLFSLSLQASHYNNHNQKNGDRHRLKASRWPERVSGVFKRPPLRCFKSDSRKQGVYVFVKMDLFNDLIWFDLFTWRKAWALYKNGDVLGYAVQRKMTKLSLFKRVCMKPGTSLDRMTPASDGWEQFASRRSPEATTFIADGQDSHEIWWCECTQARSASKSRHERRAEQRRDWQPKPSRQSWCRKLAIIYHATDIVCSFHCGIVDY